MITRRSPERCATCTSPLCPKLLIEMTFRRAYDLFSRHQQRLNLFRRFGDSSVFNFTIDEQGNNCGTEHDFYCSVLLFTDGLPTNIWSVQLGQLSGVSFIDILTLRFKRLVPAHEFYDHLNKQFSKHRGYSRRNILFSRVG